MTGSPSVAAERRGAAVRPRRRRSDAERNVETIVTAAARELSRHPGASMQEIAAASGLHRATLHRHFASRDDLVAEVKRRAFDASVAAVEDALRRGGDPRAQLRGATEGLLEVGDRFRLFRFTTTYDTVSRDRLPELRGPLERLIARAQDQAEARSDFAAAQLTTAFGGLLTSSLPAIVDGRASIADSASFILALLGVPV